MASLTLPTSAGAILLPATTLFPHGALPLTIFEPRYREMLSDSLEGDCFFCVGTLESEEVADPSACVAPVGTIGLIRASHELPDGRSELLLHGVCRVHFKKWHHDRPYPFAEIAPFHSQDISERDEAYAMERLHRVVSSIAKKLPEEAQEVITATLAKITDAFTATDAMSQQFISDPQQRKTLLEEPDVTKRLETLLHYLSAANGS